MADAAPIATPAGRHLVIPAWLTFSRLLTLGLALFVACEHSPVVVEVHWRRPAPVPVVPPIPAPPTPAPPAPPTPIPPAPVVPPPMRVVFVSDYTQATTAAHMLVLNSPAVRAYLSVKCLSDSGRPAWRFWDKSVDASKESTEWQSAWAAAKADAAPTPKLVVFSGASMKVHPLPATEADALALLQTYGGK